MSRYDDVSAELRRDPRCWLVTGAAGFIGSHVVEGLLALGQRVIGVDNFATGSRDNVMAAGGGNPLFTFHEGDCADAAFMDMACAGVDVISHQAALGSVPRSLDDPFATHRANVDGFVQVLLSGRAASVRRIVYASSSSVYGDDPSLPKREDVIGRPLSPYAATKRIDEIYADAFGRCFGLSCVGLRYFNVFGPRQERTGPYAAVIPTWVASLLGGEACTIHGDGLTSRDFCYVDNVVQANILAGVGVDVDGVYNVACGAQTTLLELFDLITSALVARGGSNSERLKVERPSHGLARPGDVRHSHADISAARTRLGYEPSHSIAQGLAVALPWYIANVTAER